MSLKYLRLSKEDIDSIYKVLSNYYKKEDVFYNYYKITNIEETQDILNVNLFTESNDNVMIKIEGRRVIVTRRFKDRSYNEDIFNSIVEDIQEYLLNKSKRDWAGVAGGEEEVSFL